MKTARLVAALQAADPSGEMNCCVSNEDIISVDAVPAYYDGALQVLVRDEKRDDYNVIGVRITTAGQKVNIRTLSVELAIMNDPEVMIDLSDLSESKRSDVKRYVDDIRSRGLEARCDSKSCICDE